MVQNGTHDFMATLLAPTAKKAGGKKLWQMDVESVLVPYFIATNAQGLTEIPSDVLGAPIRLSETKDGEIRFSTSGRPMTKAHPDLTDKVRIMRENFQASLESYTGMVQSELPEQYSDQVALAQAAGDPIMAEAVRKVDEAVETLRKAAFEQAARDAKTARAATKESKAEPTPAPELVGAAS